MTPHPTNPGPGLVSQLASVLVIAFVFVGFIAVAYGAVDLALRTLWHFAPAGAR